MADLELVRGDITKQCVGAIVNAANADLAGGGGVDGAIHRAAGYPELSAACAKLGGCPTGHAKITPGFRLPAEFVIHAVGPVWHGGGRQEPFDLEDCYKNSLRLAVDNGVRSIAFPSISTGAYGYPIEKAAPLAVRTVKAFADKEPAIERVVFVCFGQRDYDVYARALAREG